MSDVRGLPCGLGNAENHHRPIATKILVCQHLALGLLLVITGAFTACKGVLLPAHDDSGNESSAGTNSEDGGETSAESHKSGGTDEGGDGDGDGDGDDGADAGLACQPGNFHGSCPEDEKCSPTLGSPDSTWVDWAHCVPVIGDQKFAEHCRRDSEQGNDDCASGLFCFAGCSACDGTGICMQLCEAWSPESQVSACQMLGLPPNYYCFSFNEGYLPVCLETCDPILQDCSDGEGCYQSDDADYLCSEFVLDNDGTGEVGTRCELWHNCRPGLQCMDASQLADCDDDSCCAYVCDLSADDPDDVCRDSGEVCVAMQENPVPGKERVGVCGLAP